MEIKCASLNSVESAVLDKANFHQKVKNKNDKKRLCIDVNISSLNMLPLQVHTMTLHTQLVATDVPAKQLPLGRVFA